ncbi:MAG: hypothetical protein HZC55_26585 [Verrucomicrobia bacterium]|nr:hypothetical protein [Verrucomicrobiota bacterium]
MSRISDIVAKSTIREYAQGAAQEGVSPVGDFLAPTVEVSKATGYFKVYSEKSRFRVPDTRRAIGGPATQLGWDRTDGQFNVEAHALDVPVDILETDEEDTMEAALQEASDLGAEVGALSHEKEVVDLAITTTAGGAANIDFAAAADPIDQIDQHIISVIKAANYGAMMGIRMLFGPTYARRLKNHPLVRGRFPGAAKVAPSVEEIVSLFLAKPEVRLSTMVYDDAPEGKAKDIKFILDDKLLIFAARPSPTRRDPSFMKTFRLRGKWMTPRTYRSPDGRQEVAGLDWSGKPYVTNSAAAKQLGITN